MTNKGITDYFRVKLKKNSLPLKIITALLLLYSLILLVIICYHTFPVPEDYRITYDASRMWGIKFILFCYQNIDGRWFTNVLYLFNPLIIRFFAGYSVLPLFLAFLLGCSVFSLLKTIIGHKYPLRVIFLLTVAFLFVYISLIPDMSSFLCFMGATFSYTVPLILLNYLISELIKFCLYRRSVIKEITIISLLVACVCGTNESYLVTCLLLLSTAMIFAFFRKRSIIRYLLIPFIVYSGVAAFSLSSPGNSNRISVEKTISKEKSDSQNSITARLSSTLQRENTSVVQTARRYLATPLFISASLLFFSIMLLYSKKPVTPQKIWPYLPLSIIIILFIFYFIPFVYYFSGLNTTFIYHSRVYNIVLFLFLLTWMLILSGISAIVADKIPVALKTTFLVAAIIAASLSLHFSDNNVSTLIHQLQNGKLNAFRNESVKRLDILNNINPNFFAGRKLQSIVILNPLQHYTALTFSQDLIPYDSTHTKFDEGMAGFFGLKKVKLVSDTTITENILPLRQELLNKIADPENKPMCSGIGISFKKAFIAYRRFVQCLGNPLCQSEVFNYFDTLVAPTQLFRQYKLTDSLVFACPGLRDSAIKRISYKEQQNIFKKQLVRALLKDASVTRQSSLFRDFVSATPPLGLLSRIESFGSDATLFFKTGFILKGEPVLYEVYMTKIGNDYKVSGFGSYNFLKKLASAEVRALSVFNNKAFIITGLHGELNIFDSTFTLAARIIKNCHEPLKSVKVMCEIIHDPENETFLLPLSFDIYSDLGWHEEFITSCSVLLTGTRKYLFNTLSQKPVKFVMKSITMNYGRKD